MPGKAVVVGTGALALGFLGPKLCPDYELCFADVAAKAGLLARLQAEQGYRLNLCGPDGIEAAAVAGKVAACNLGDAAGRRRFDDALRQADLVLTAVGAGNLPAVLPAIARVLNPRHSRCHVLLCENGRDLAAKHRGLLGGHVVLCDTVMGRMCRFAEPDEADYAPMWDGAGERLAAETYGFLPVDRALCPPEVFSDAFTPVSREEFAAWEDIKFYAHNGVHAFLSYHAYLSGIRCYCDIPAALRDAARRVLLDEVCPALARAHPAFPARITTEHTEANTESHGEGTETAEPHAPSSPCSSVSPLRVLRGDLPPSAIREHAEGLLVRFFNPFFRDRIERGVRGVMDKLGPEERLVAGLRFLAAQGIPAPGYASTIRAGIESARRWGEVSGETAQILAQHCGIQDPALLRLVLS